MLKSLLCAVSCRAGPFVLSVPRAELPQLLWDILNREFMKRPDWATELVKLEAERPRLMPNVLELTHLVCQGTRFSAYTHGNYVS